MTALPLKTALPFETRTFEAPRSENPRRAKAAATDRDEPETPAFEAALEEESGSARERKVDAKKAAPEASRSEEPRKTADDDATL